MNSNIDLHMHSKRSDGSDTVQKLLKKIKTLGITTFALTDHDTVKGALEMEKLVPPEIKYIRGIELSCKTEIAKCHILVYGYDPGNTAFQELVAEAHRKRKNKNKKRFTYLEKTFGFEFTEEEKASFDEMESPGKPEFKELIEKKLKQMDPEGEEVNIYETYLKGMPSDRMDAIRSVKTAIAAGGIAVWAHPLGGTGEKRLSKSDFDAQLAVLMQSGIKGLECFYSEYTMEEAEMLRRIAEQKGLLVSGGSDYHGTRKPHLHLGMLNKEDEIVSEEKLTIFNSFYLKE